MGERRGMLIDVSKCIGCRACQVACKQWNGMPAEKTSFSGSYENPQALSGNTWTKVMFTENVIDSKVQFLFRKIQCMHCTEASCIAVCAAGAPMKLDNGHVVIDQNKCIGCKNCVLACPFGAVKHDPVTGTSKKCWGCQDRLENGLVPACASACPTGALQFGDRDEMLAAAKQRAEELRKSGIEGGLYGEKELGGTNNIYVLDAPPKVYGLPENPKSATAGLVNNWLGLLFGAGIVALAPFRMLFKDQDTGIDKTKGTGVDQNA